MVIQYMDHLDFKIKWRNIVQLDSGYIEDANNKPNRPPTSLFPPEFFVEDFTYKESL